MGCVSLRPERAIVMRRAMVGLRARRDGFRRDAPRNDSACRLARWTLRGIIGARPSPSVVRVLADHFEIDRPSALVAASPARWIKWLMISVLAALLAWFGFRGYLNPDLLFHFANSLYC